MASLVRHDMTVVLQGEGCSGLLPLVSPKTLPAGAYYLVIDFTAGVYSLANTPTPFQYVSWENQNKKVKNYLSISEIPQSLDVSFF